MVDTTKDFSLFDCVVEAAIDDDYSPFRVVRSAFLEPSCEEKRGTLSSFRDFEKDHGTAWFLFKQGDNVCIARPRGKYITLPVKTTGETCSSFVGKPANHQDPPLKLRCDVLVDEADLVKRVSPVMWASSLENPERLFVENTYPATRPTILEAHLSKGSLFLAYLRYNCKSTLGEYPEGHEWVADYFEIEKVDKLGTRVNKKFDTALTRTLEFEKSGKWFSLIPSGCFMGAIQIKEAPVLEWRDEVYRILVQVRSEIYSVFVDPGEDQYSRAVLEIPGHVPLYISFLIEQHLKGISVIQAIALSDSARSL